MKVLLLIILALFISGVETHARGPLNVEKSAVGKEYSTEDAPGRDNSSRRDIPSGEDDTDTTEQGPSAREDALKIQILNQGRDQRNLTTKEYLETLSPEELQKKVEESRGNMSEVASKVQQILADPERTGGIGEQVREIAEEQNEAQNRLQERYEKLQGRARLFKFFFGPEKSAIEDIEAEITKNEARIEELETLLEEADTQDQAEELEGLIESIQDQNISLMQTVEVEKTTGSVIQRIARGISGILGKIR